MLKPLLGKTHRFLCFALDFTSISASVNIVNFLRIADKKLMVKKLTSFLFWMDPQSVEELMSCNHFTHHFHPLV